MAVAMGLMALLYFVSRSTKDNFNLFYFGHITLYLVLIIPAFLHGAVVLGASVFLWLLDVLIRYVFTKKTVKADISILSGDIVKISLPGGSFAYEAGQYCFLRVSMVNGYEYHPFTISSDASEEKIGFHVRKSGDWTTQLYDMVKEKAKTTDPSGSGNMLSVEGEVAVEGPYGRLSIDLFNSELYETVVLIGGGIGITPCLSVWKHLLQSVSKPKKVVFVWVVREAEAAEKMYVDQFEGRVDEEREIVFQETSSSLVKEDTRFQYHFHVTRHVDDPLDRADLEAESRQARKRRWNAGRLKMHEAEEGGDGVGGGEGEAAEKMYVDQFEGRVDEERELVVYENGDESIALKDDTIFEYHLYVTQKTKSQENEKVKGKPAREIQVEMKSVESGHGHRKRFNEGRLDTDKLFKGVADYVTSLPREGGGKGRVGVVVCGPFPLITGVHRSVNSSDVRGRVSVDVHEEFFSL
eukprot:CAMPEP_0173167582 /NCGR_PEP_ID=MMETSP1105-20130129/22746_1 /TAXON_ID=2985 /ORGANISM="Ochromonas sp., Strain BG-1" /LENGTH=466 /DNA_ID=CAMNT_0014089145 /DNA_START=341 /DNA_END=1742 /DNA_ORIENTATION=-